jgi:hypothetical protein
MVGTIYCLVDTGDKVYVEDGAESYADVAADCEVDENACQKYRFDLTNRRLVVDRGKPASQRTVRTYLDQYVGTPDRLIDFAKAGHLPKGALVNLLDTDNRQAYLDACAVIEKKYTEDCTATSDSCLESGCAVEGEICLQPLLRAGIEYHRACAAEWIKLFADPRNRVDAWKN